MRHCTEKLIGPVYISIYFHSCGNYDLLEDGRSPSPPSNYPGGTRHGPSRTGRAYGEPVIQGSESITHG